MNSTMSRLELLLQIPAVAIPTGILATILSVLSTTLSELTEIISFLGASAGLFVSVMLIIINWKKMVTAGKAFWKKCRK